MGYYSDFSIKFSGPENEMQELMTYVKESWAEEINISNIEIKKDKFCVYDQKWYNHESDLQALSMLYPNLNFDVIVVGEENGPRNLDVNRYLVNDGRIQKLSFKLSWIDSSGDEVFEGLH